MYSRLSFLNIYFYQSFILFTEGLFADLILNSVKYRNYDDSMKKKIINAVAR